ncbi:MAG: VacJ family lipoprotein [Pseudomonadota bacterium]
MRRQISRIFGAMLLTFTVASCAEAPPGQLISDPYERGNRKVHEFNKGFDRALVGPVANAYGKVIGPDVDASVQAAAETISLPNRILNKVLQFRLLSAFQDTMRLTVNLAVGLGIKDPATEFGIPNDDTDFGETLHVWGFKEGNFIEVPFWGASTERDAVGLIVDLFLLDPIGEIEPKARPITATVTLTSYISNRNEFADLVDSILYDSEDSYSAQQLAYVQNRRFNLSKSGPNGAVVDDPYGDDLLDDLFDQDL